jgi:putative hydrolase of the HAD superfamily
MICSVIFSGTPDGSVSAAHPMPPITDASLAQFDTVFLDVGNTLISIDFGWMADELAARGHPCGAGALLRAEAAARPAYSRRLFVEGVPAGTDLFREYLRSIVSGIDAIAALPPDAGEALLADLRVALRPDGKASSLWKLVMPGVPDALARLARRGLRLVVVSNSDGTVARSLDAAGLLPHLALVIDSALVGFEKPDPRIFLAALARAGAEASRTIHVGDLYHADVLGARGAGITPLLLDPFGDWPDPDCLTARDLGDLADAFEAA